MCVVYNSDTGFNCTICHVHDKREQICPHILKHQVMGFKFTFYCFKLPYVIISSHNVYIEIPRYIYAHIYIYIYLYICFSLFLAHIPTRTPHNTRYHSLTLSGFFHMNNFTFSDKDRKRHKLSFLSLTSLDVSNKMSVTCC